MINFYSVYLTRSFRNNKVPFIAWPFNLAEFALLLVLYAKDNGLDTSVEVQPVTRMVIDFVVSIQFSYCCGIRFFKYCIDKHSVFRYQ